MFLFGLAADYAAVPGLPSCRLMLEL